MKTINLSIGYKKSIVSDISVSLPVGLTALVGRNGIGKSTLIKTLTGHLPPLRGEIILDNKNIKDYSKKELSRKISYISTDFNASGGLRVKEFVGLGRIPYTGFLGKLKGVDKLKIEEAMSILGIKSKADIFISNLSDGERQKAKIARCFAQETPVIIMDEPFSFLDVAARLELLALINQIGIEKEKAILFSTHEVAETLRMTRRLWMLSADGILEGATEDLINNGALEKLFDNDNIVFDRNLKDFIYTG